MDIKKTVSIIGLGIRGGEVYGKYIYRARKDYSICALCDTQASKLQRYGKAFQVAPENCFQDEEEFFKCKRSELLIIATPDKSHMQMALRGLKLGYHVLLETPVSVDLQDLRELSVVAERLGRVVMPANVLRYSTAIRKLRAQIESGEIGKINSIDYTENVGFWHAAHSYVRGNWRRTEDSAPMILTKCCHDFDILLYLIGSKCVRISSMGSRLYFKLQNKPSGASDRCVQCKYVESCPYSAKKIYIDMWKNGAERESAWPMSAITDVRPLTEEALYGALETSPYGRCVFHCDNNVVDNQSTVMQFENGVTASLNMKIFVKDGGREIRVHGSLGELIFRETENVVSQKLFFGEDTHWRVSDLANSANLGGKNREERLIDDFFAAANDEAHIKGVEAFLENHYMALGAEESRLNDGKVIDLIKYRNGDSALQYILDYIDGHYLEDITIKTVAHGVGYSEGYCAKLLKKYSGDNFRDYLNKKRLRRVDELLSDKTLDMTWLEIIYSSGFNCPSTYYRTKKKLQH